MFFIKIEVKAVSLEMIKHNLRKSFKHSQEKIKSSSINYYSFPLEKEDKGSFYKDQLQSIQYKSDALNLETLS